MLNNVIICNIHKYIHCNYLTGILIQTYCCFSVLAHECYVCTEQDGNSGKCTTTVALCQYEEESCMTTVGWGSKSLDLDTSAQNWVINYMLC